MRRFALALLLVPAAAALAWLELGRERATRTAEAAPPAPALTEVVGRSLRGRPIVARRLGDPDGRRALVVGAIHGDEEAGMDVVQRLEDGPGLAGTDLWVLDTVNPDGLARGTRTNARGVDLNRNFPHGWAAIPRPSGYHSGRHALSEPEARAVGELIVRLRPAVTVWYHQPWGAVLVPCRGDAPLQRRYARLSGMRTSCRGDGLPGTASSWQRRAVPGSVPFVVELGRRPLSPAAAERHARALIGVVARAR